MLQVGVAGFFNHLGRFCLHEHAQSGRERETECVFSVWCLLACQVLRSIRASEQVLSVSVPVSSTGRHLLPEYRGFILLNVSESSPADLSSMDASWGYQALSHSHVLGLRATEEAAPLTSPCCAPRYLLPEVCAQDT